MPEETVTELHLSPPCYGNVALDPHCVAMHHVFTLSGVPFNAVAEAANGTVVPHLVVFGDTLSGEVHLNEVQGATPSESFDKVVAFAKSCGIPHGPVHVHETLRPRQKAQAASLRIYLEATLLPPLCWARATKHRALHRAQLSQHTGLLSVCCGIAAALALVGPLSPCCHCPCPKHTLTETPVEACPLLHRG